MIAPAETPENPDSTAAETARPDHLVLARYGRVPQVARFAGTGDRPDRGTTVVARTDRGEELATVLQCLPAPQSSGVEDEPALTGSILRIASPADLNAAEHSATTLEHSFADWVRRAAEWKLQLELIDLEQTLDGRLILYVLNDRGAETTRLALLAAAAGCGIVHVQPVSADGIIQTTGGGCGSGGCGSGGCSSH